MGLNRPGHFIAPGGLGEHCLRENLCLFSFQYHTCKPTASGTQGRKGASSTLAALAYLASTGVGAQAPFCPAEIRAWGLGEARIF